MIEVKMAVQQVQRHFDLALATKINVLPLLADLADLLQLNLWNGTIPLVEHPNHTQ